MPTARALGGQQRAGRASTRLRTGVEAEVISRQGAGAKAGTTRQEELRFYILKRARPCFCIGLPGDRARTKELKRRPCEAVARAKIVDQKE